MPEAIPADAKQLVIVAKNRSSIVAQKFDTPVVAIIPDTRNWNDFGRGYFAKLYVIDEQKKETEFHLRIMFEGYDRSSAALMEAISEFGELFPIEKIETPFVSLLPEADFYKDFIELMGFDKGIVALRKIHDATTLRFEGGDENLVEMTKSEEFSIGALRYGGAYSALRRGASHFTRTARPTVEDSAQNFSFTTKLPNSSNEIEVDFDFETTPVFRDRIAVLVGQNGSGKTQFLKSIVDGLVTQNRDDNVDLTSPFSPPVTFHRTLVFSAVPTDPYPRQLGAWNGIDYDYFPLNSARLNTAESLLEALVAIRFENDKIDFGGDSETSRLNILLDVLEELDLKHLYLPLRQRNEDDDLPHVVEVEGSSYLWIGRQFNELNSLLAYQQVDWSRSPIVLDDNLGPRFLSSGELAMIRFAAQTIASIETGSLLLLDEPETHLHPKYISKLIEVLYSLLKATRSIAIIATHSAYMVREVSRSNVKVLSVKDGKLFFHTPRMQTFGASIDTISQFAFGDTDEQHHFQQVLVDWARSVAPEIGIEGIIQEFGEHLNSESLSFIARSLKRSGEED